MSQGTSEDPIARPNSSGQQSATASGVLHSVAYRSLPQLLLLAFVAVVFGRIISYGFVNFDDPTHLAENPYLNPISLKNLGHLWSNSYDGLYIPVSYTFFALEGLIAEFLATKESAGPFDPRVFHLASLLLHAGCGLVVFRILRRMVTRDVAAFAGALCFLIHPLQVESVAWVSETRGLLSTFFSLIAIWQYLQFTDSTTRPRDDSGSKRPLRTAAHYLLATTAFVLALLSKPSAVALPLIVALIDIGILKRSWQNVFRSIIPWLIFAAAAAYLTKSSQPDQAVHDIAPWSMRWLIAGDALAFYLQKLLVPFPLCVDYGRSPRVMLESRWLDLTWLVPILAGIFLLSFRQARRYWVPAAIFAAGLSPVLGLVPFKFQYYSTVADRYVYLSMFGPAMACAFLLDRNCKSAVVAGLITIGIGWSLLAGMQVSHWKDDATLYAQTLAVNPASFLAHNNLGLALQRQNQPSDALRHFQAALEINPDFALAHFNLGVLLHDMGYRHEAIEQFRTALAIDPTDAASLVRLGAILAEMGQVDEGMSKFHQAIDSQPDYAAAHLNLGIALYQTGQVQEAIPSLQRALELSPNDSHTHFVLGWAYYTQRDDADARQHFEQYLASGQENADVSNALGEIALRAGDQRQAISHFRNALRLNPQSEKAADNLKRALGE